MNLRLSPTQIDEILAAAEHGDVPAEQLVAAAAEIRATLLAASGEISLVPDAPRAVHRPPAPHTDPVRRARAVRTALVAAALALALVLSAAVAGALPDPIQHPVERVAEFFGVDLPSPDRGPALDVSTGLHDPASTADDEPARSTSSTTAPPTPTTIPAAAAPAVEETPPETTPPEAHGDGNALGNASGPARADVNGPPDDPRNRNGNGPPDEPGNDTGNGNESGDEK